MKSAGSRSQVFKKTRRRLPDLPSTPTNVCSQSTPGCEDFQLNCGQIFRFKILMRECSPLPKGPQWFKCSRKFNEMIFFSTSYFGFVIAAGKAALRSSPLRYCNPFASVHALGQRSLGISTSLKLDVMFAARSDAVLQNQHRPDIRFKCRLVHGPIPVCYACPKPFPYSGGRSSKGYNNGYLQKPGLHDPFPFLHLGTLLPDSFVSDLFPSVNNPPAPEAVPKTKGIWRKPNPLSSY